MEELKRKTYYVYQITNVVTGKRYIGVSGSPSKRWIRHKCNAAKKYNHPLYDSMNKYGMDKFSFELIFCSRDQGTIYQTEVAMINDFDSIENGYNLSVGGIGGRAGVKRTEAEKRHLSKFWMGKTFSEDTKKKISLALSGKKMSDEAKHKMSLAKRGRTPHNKTIFMAKNELSGEVRYFSGYKELCLFLGVETSTARKLLRGLARPRKHGRLESIMSQGWRLFSVSKDTTMAVKI